MTENTTTAGTLDVIDAMFKVGAHFGYSRARRHSSVKTALFGAKNGVDIIDLEKTAVQLSRAIEFVSGLSKEGKNILFVGSKNEVRDIVEAAARSIDMPFVVERWIGGTFTNFSEIKKRILYMKDLSDKTTKGELEKYTKKERLLLERELESLKTNFGGLCSLDNLPSALFVVDPREENIAVVEAMKMNIPVVALLNSDCNMNEIDYPIVANDAAVPSVTHFVNEIRDAYRAGKKIA